MQIEIRSDCAVIKGYVNAVERDSREMDTAKGGFVEQVRSGTWGKAINAKENIPMLLNHDKTRQLASTKDNTLKLTEDNIGLHAEARVYDKEVIQKAKDNKLVGWSFGFIKEKESWGKTDNGVDRRYLEEIELTEVSVLDNTRTPAYFGTSVEKRGTENINIEQRTLEDSSKIIENEENKNENLTKKIKLMELELEI